jgi:hypothetical protein
MHKLRINMSVNSKIMINSPYVCFDITRQCARVEHKSINMFSKKNHLGRFYRIGQQFISQDSLHNFVQLLVQELVLTRHTTYPKCRYREVVDLKL